MVHLENISQKTNNREFAHRPIAMARLSHTVDLQTILQPQQYYKQKQNGRKAVSDTIAKENKG